MFSEHKAEPYTAWKRLCNEYYPRVALLLSIVKGDTSKAAVITPEGWKKAAILVQYFFGEAERVFGGLHFDPRQGRFEGLCEKILNFVKAKGGRVGRQEVSWQLGKGTKAKDRHEAIVELVNRGDLIAEQGEKGGVTLVIKT